MATAIRNDHGVVQAVSHPQLMGDERDQIVAGLNQLLALAGANCNVYYQAGQPPAQLTSSNPFSRFKAVGYSHVGESEDSSGLVSLVVGRNASQVSSQQQQVKDIIYKILGNRPTLAVQMHAVKPVLEEKCEVVVSVLENGSKTISSSQLAAFLSQPNNYIQLEQQLCVQSLAPNTKVDAHKLNEYMHNPPLGIDPVVWAEAKSANPDPEKLIPYPIIGFSQLAERHRMQNQERQLQDKCFNQLREGVETVSGDVGGLVARIKQVRHTEQLLAHRLLTLVAVETLRVKQGAAVEGDEEQLQSALVELHRAVNGPVQLGGRLCELAAVVSSRPDLLRAQTTPAPNVGDAFVREAYVVLAKCHSRVERLVETVEEDSDIVTRLGNEHHKLHC